MSARVEKLMTQYLTGLCLVLLLNSNSLAAPAHNHGEADMVVVLEEMTLTITVEAHQADLAGFEREPHTDEEKRVLQELASQLSEHDQLFALTRSAECSASDVELSGLQPDAEEPSESKAPSHEHEEDGHDHEEHEDDDHHEDHHVIAATYIWACAKPQRLRHVDVQLFEKFPAVRAINTVVFTEGNQTGVILRPEQSRISF